MLFSLTIGWQNLDRVMSGYLPVFPLKFRLFGVLFYLLDGLFILFIAEVV